MNIFVSQCFIITNYFCFFPCIQYAWTPFPIPFFFTSTVTFTLLDQAAKYELLTSKTESAQVTDSWGKAESVYSDNVLWFYSGNWIFLWIINNTDTAVLQYRLSHISAHLKKNPTHKPQRKWKSALGMWWHCCECLLLLFLFHFSRTLVLYLGPFQSHIMEINSQKEDDINQVQNNISIILIRIKWLYSLFQHFSVLLLRKWFFKKRHIGTDICKLYLLKEYKNLNDIFEVQLAGGVFSEHLFFLFFLL